MQRNVSDFKQDTAGLAEHLGICRHVVAQQQVSIGRAVPLQQNLHPCICHQFLIAQAVDDDDGDDSGSDDATASSSKVGSTQQAENGKTKANSGSKTTSTRNSTMVDVVEKSRRRQQDVSGISRK